MEVKNVFLVEQLFEEWVLLMKVEKEDEAEKTAALLNKTLLKPVRVLKCTVEETVLFNTSNQ
jgi:hypothetical protein